MTTYFDADNSSTDLALSSGGKVITKASGAQAGWRPAVSPNPKSSGKWYFETLVVDVVSHIVVGAGVPENIREASIYNSDNATRRTPELSGYPGSMAGSVGVYSHSSLGTLAYAGGSSYIPTGAPGFASGDVIGHAYDADSGTYDIYINGTLVQHFTSASHGVTAGYAPAAGLYDQGGIVTLRLSAGEFTRTPPSGYQAWAPAGSPDSALPGAQYSAALASDDFHPGSIGVNTTDPAGGAWFYTDHLYWKKNLLPAAGAGMALEFLFGRYSLGTQASYDRALPDTPKQSVLLCCRAGGNGHGGSYTGVANDFGVGMAAADLVKGAWLQLLHSKVPAALTVTIPAWGSYTTSTPTADGYGFNIEHTQGPQWSGALCSVTKTSGKWYWEVKPSGSTDITCGVTAGRPADPYQATSDTYLHLRGASTVVKNAQGAYTAVPEVTAGSVIGIAFDVEANSVQFFVDNVPVITAGPALASGWFTAFVGLFGGQSAEVRMNANALTYAPPAGYTALGGSEGGGSAHNLTLKLGNITESGADTVVNGPTIAVTDHDPDFAQHVVLCFDAESNGQRVVTLYHNGQPGQPVPVSPSLCQGANGSVLFGPCLTPPVARTNGYYFDSIAYYPSALTAETVATHYQTAFEGIDIPSGSSGGTGTGTGTGATGVRTRDLRFTFVPATDNSTLGLHKIAVSGANGDILTGATRTLPVGSWENTSMGWFGPGPSNAPFVVEYRLTDSVEVSSITDYQIGAGSNLGYSQMLTMGWTLEYKNAVGVWVELDTRNNITWTMRMLNTYIIGGGSSSLPEQLGFDPASVAAPAELIGPDYSTLQLKNVADWGISYLSRGGQLRRTHTTGKWYFEITVDDIMIPNDAQYPRAIEVTVSSGASYATGVDSASVRYDMGSDGSINRIIYTKYLSILGQVITWFADRPDIDIAPLSTAGKTICVLVDMSGSRANVAIGERSATGQPVKWFDGTTMTSIPVSMASAPVWWAKSLDKSVPATARVQIINMQATVRVNSGETAPIFAVPTGTYGWGLSS